MVGFLQLSFTAALLGYLCVAAGALVILASVVFVIKGKAVLSEAGAPNQIAFKDMKASFTSSIALFVLGAAMIVLPFWEFQQENSQVEQTKARQPPMARLTGTISGPSGTDVRLLLVVKPDYDQSYRDQIEMPVPLIANKSSYTVFFVQGNTILAEKSFSVQNADPGGPEQSVALPAIELQTGNAATAPVEQITPKLEVSNDELKKLGIN